MKKVIYILAIGLTTLLIGACGSKMTFEDQIKKDIYDKISSGYCEADNISKDAEIKNLKIGDITPIGDTGMIDVALEFDMVNSDGTEQHMEEAMLYLESKKGGRKMLAVFCDYDYRDKN